MIGITHNPLKPVKIPGSPQTQPAAAVAATPVVSDNPARSALAKAITDRQIYNRDAAAKT